MRPVRRKSSTMTVTKGSLVNYISVDDERSTSLVRGVTFETVEPGCSANQTVNLTSGGPGKRILDFSIQSKVNGVASVAGAENETLLTVSIDTVEPFRQESYITYSQPHKSLPVFPEVTVLNDWEYYTAEAMVTFTLESVADCELEITSIKLIDIVSFSAFLRYTLLIHAGVHAMQASQLFSAIRSGRTSVYVTLCSPALVAI